MRLPGLGRRLGSSGRRSTARPTLSAVQPKIFGAMSLPTPDRPRRKEAACRSLDEVLQADGPLLAGAPYPCHQAAGGCERCGADTVAVRMPAHPVRSPSLKFQSLAAPSQQERTAQPHHCRSCPEDLRTGELILDAGPPPWRRVHGDRRDGTPCAA